MQGDAYHYEMKVDNQYYSGHKAKEYYIRAEVKAGKRNPKPVETIIQRNPSNMIGKKIIKYKSSFGDFGGSGAGFLGFQFEPGGEWLVFTINDTAMCHMLLDGKWVEATYTDINFFKPDHSPWRIYGVNSRIDKDEFTPLIQGAVIKDVKLTDDTFNITFEKDGQSHLLKTLNTDKRLCPLSGPYVDKKKIVYPKALHPEEKMGDYIIFIQDGGDIYLY